MTSLAQSSSISPAPINSQSLAKVLDTTNLPKNTLLPIYLISRSVTLSDSTTNENYKACCISFIQNLVVEKDLKLADLIQEKRIGALHIENHKVKSLTVPPEMLEIFTKANIKGVTIIQGEQILSVEDHPMIRAFASDEQYKKYTAKLV